MFKNYYLLTKPGIVYGNSIAAIAGFFVASKWHINPLLLLVMLVGLGLVIASACVFNNYIDRGIDEKMARTKKRAMVEGTISHTFALTFGTVLGIIGFATLIIFTNLLTAFVAFIGFFFYVVVYGIAKRKTLYGTLIGSIPGAVPPVVGYVAVTNRFDLGSLLLFLILVAWQMPHFYAIAMYRLKDYANAGLPVLPVKSGMLTTKIHILFWVICFLLVTSLLTVFGFTGYLYLTIMGILSITWLVMGIKGFWAKDDTKWAKHMFFFSLIALLLVSLMMSINVI